MTEGQKLEALAKEHGAPWPTNPVAEMEAAMCLWEAYLAAERAYWYLQADAIREANQGTVQLRHNFMALAQKCSIGWSIFNDDSRVFDWEYVPLFLSRCVVVSDKEPIRLNRNWVSILKNRT